MTYLLACDDTISRLGLAVRAKRAAEKIRGAPSEGVRNVRTKLAIVIIVSWLLLQMRWQPLAIFFRLIGFYALFAFIVHRILLQTLHIGLNVLDIENPLHQYGLLLMGTMLLTFCLCWWRQHYAEALRTSARAVEAIQAIRPLPGRRRVASSRAA